MTDPGELSPLDQQYATSLRLIQPEYQYQDPPQKQLLRDKIMLGTLGPIGSRKLLLRNTIIQRAPEFSAFGIRTTRPRKDNDLDNFLTAENGITHASMNKNIMQNELVDFSVSHKGHLTGSVPDDIGRFAIGKIHAESVDNLANADFKAFYAVFVLSRGALYHRHLREKLACSTATISQQQLNSAESSLQFAQQNLESSFMLFVDLGDSEEALHGAADAVIRTTHQRTRPIMTHSHIAMILDEMDRAVQNVGRQLV